MTTFSKILAGIVMAVALVCGFVALNTIWFGTTRGAHALHKQLY
ncbi:MAG TPA: hypothetical protein VNZ03_00510 [Terriglobales bacterium]|nr:hypothetical protein [Terriglobales bacterium]